MKALHRRVQKLEAQRPDDDEASFSKMTASELRAEWAALSKDPEVAATLREIGVTQELIDANDYEEITTDRGRRHLLTVRSGLRATAVSYARIPRMTFRLRAPERRLLSSYQWLEADGRDVSWTAWRVKRIGVPCGSVSTAV